MTHYSDSLFLLAYKVADAVSCYNESQAATDEEAARIYEDLTHHVGGITSENGHDITSGNRTFNIKYEQGGFFARSK